MASAMKWHAISPANVCSELDTSAENGLASTEAQIRLAKHGRNALTPPPKPSLLVRAWRQFNNTVMYLLLTTVVLSGIFGSWIQMGLIICVMGINITIGMVQEGRAEQAAAAIASMLASTAVVVRDGGQRREVDAQELVVGDVIVLSSGDRIPADARIISCDNLEAQEAALTGESTGVTKSPNSVAETAGIGDRSSMVFSGTYCFRGSGKAVVVATGDHAEIGRVNAMMRTVSATKAPLIRQLEFLGRTLAVIAIALGFITFCIAYWGRRYNPIDSVEAGISIAVACIPEGILSVVTITLAIGVQKMAKRNAIVRSLPAVETLGNVTVICSDKTGTLTKNEMTAVSMMCAEGVYTISGSGYSPQGAITRESGDVTHEEKTFLRDLLLPAVITSEAVLRPRAIPGADMGLAASDALQVVPASILQQWDLIGEPTEGALLALAMKSGYQDPESMRHTTSATGRIPFDSAYKFMATMHPVSVDPLLTATLAQSGPGSSPSGVVLIKGGADVLLKLCTHVINRVDGNITYQDIQRDEWLAAVEKFARQGLRVVALVHAEVNEPGLVQLKPEHVLKPREFVGLGRIVLRCLVAIIDPPRDEAITAVTQCHKAGIVVKMITGDHEKTAWTIASWLGITRMPGSEFQPPSTAAAANVLSGAQLEAMTDEELRRRVMHVNVFARASPAHKLRIVKALQTHRMVVAMTGDGVNDAPALKQADVGVAMGITGTDVARQAARMVLADDNFATIVAAIGQGRGLTDNIRKVLLFALPTNLSQGLCILAAMILGLPTPLTALQVLFANMVTSVTLGIVLALEPPEPTVLERPPRRPGKPLIGKFVAWRLGFVTTLLVVAILGNAYWELQWGGSDSEARTVATCNLVVTQCFYCMNCRYLSAPSYTFKVFYENPWLAGGILLDISLLVLIAYTPGVQSAFSTAAIDIFSWLRIFMFAIAVFVIVELEKKFGPEYINPYVLPVVGRCLRACRWCCKTQRRRAGAESSPAENESAFELTAAGTGASKSADEVCVAVPTSVESKDSVLIKAEAQI